jgi:hypothetical protein
MNDDLEQREKDIREQLERIRVLPKQHRDSDFSKPNWLGLGVAALIVIVIALATYLNIFW